MNFIIVFSLSLLLLLLLLLLYPHARRQRMGKTICLDFLRHVSQFTLGWNWSWKTFSHHRHRIQRILDLESAFAKCFSEFCWGVCNRSCALKTVNKFDCDGSMRATANDRVKKVAIWTVERAHRSDSYTSRLCKTRLIGIQSHVCSVMQAHVIAHEIELDFDGEL